MKTVSAKYARQNFAELVNEVHLTRKRVLITKSGKPMVIFISVKEKYPQKNKSI